MEYTKGKWLNHNGVIETQYAPQGAVISEINKATEKWEANAQLISAAPDMYEALKKAERTIEVALNKGTFLPKLNRAVRKALAKAEGREKPEK